MSAERPRWRLAEADAQEVELNLEQEMERDVTRIGDMIQDKDMMVKDEKGERRRLFSSKTEKLTQFGRGFIRKLLLEQMEKGDVEDRASTRKFFWEEFEKLDDATKK